VPDRLDDLFGCVFLDEVASALEDHGAVIGEALLPAPSLGVAEGDVPGRPDDERKALFDLRENGRLARISRGNTWTGRREAGFGKGPRYASITASESLLRLTFEGRILSTAVQSFRSRR